MDRDGVPDSARAMLRSFQNVLGMDTLGLLEETIPRSSSQRNTSLVKTGSQDGEMRRLGQAVIVPLKSGLQSFNDVSEILLRLREDVLPDSQTFRDIRRQIVNMKQQIQSSESIAAGELAELDRKTELLTAEQGRLAGTKKEKELHLDRLEKQLGSYRSTLENLRDSLSTHRRDLESAEDTLESMRNKRGDAERKRNLGIGLTPIPVVGLFVGVPLVLAGDADMKQASKSINTARGEVDNCEAEVSSYRHKISEYQSKIYDVKRKIGAADDKIHRAVTELRVLSGRREAVADVQAKMRRVVHHLGVLSGVGSVVELHTRRQVLLAPVMTVMEEMTTALGRIAGDELLNTEGIKSLMGRVKRNQCQLQQLAGAGQRANLDYY